MENLEKFIYWDKEFFAETLVDFLAECKKKGYAIQHFNEGEGLIHLSKAGNPQVVFENKNGKRIYLQVSFKLREALSAGEKYSLTACPIYKIIDKDIFVIGLESENNPKSPHFTSCISTNLL